MNPISSLYWSVNKKLKTAVLASLLTLSGFAGLASAPYVMPQTFHTVSHHYAGIEVQSPISRWPHITESLELWKREVARRFPTALIYAIHGNTDGTNWVCLDPKAPRSGHMVKVRDLALQLRKENPDRVIVLIICNPGGFNLGIPGVFHAMDSVWFDPDKDADNTDPGRQEDRGCVGNIFEFNDK